MKKLIAVQMDALSALDAATDSTLVLMREAARRGYALYQYTPDRLSLHNGKPVAWARPVAMSEAVTPGEAEALPLEQASAVLMRQNPPFDMGYVSATYLLERLRGKTPVVNDAAEVRNNPEKLFPLQFPEFIPPTLISAHADDIRAFHREHKEIVLKPLYGYGGEGVFKIGQDGANLSALLELMLTRTTPLVAQMFLPDVTSAERRIVLIDGKFSGIYARIPASGQIRANVHSGGTAQPAEITPRQREICAALGPVLKQKGLLFAGIDVVGDKLIEINITSPTGLTYVKQFCNATPERAFWDAVEERM